MLFAVFFIMVTITILAGIFLFLTSTMEYDIGKLCYFWGKKKLDYAYGVLTSITNEGNQSYFYIDEDGLCYEHCRRLTAKEIKELC